MKKFLKFLYTPASTIYNGTASVSNMGYYPEFDKIIVRFDIGSRKELHIYDEDWNLINKYDRYSSWEYGHLGNPTLTFKRAKFKEVHIPGLRENEPIIIYFPNHKEQVKFDYDDCISESFVRTG